MVGARDLHISRIQAFSQPIDGTHSFPLRYPAISIEIHMGNDRGREDRNKCNGVSSTQGIVHPESSNAKVINQLVHIRRSLFPFLLLKSALVSASP